MEDHLVHSFKLFVSFIESEDKYTSPSKDGNDMGQVKKKKKKKKKIRW